MKKILFSETHKNRIEKKAVDSLFSGAPHDEQSYMDTYGEAISAITSAFLVSETILGEADAFISDEANEKLYKTNALLYSEALYKEGGVIDKVLTTLGQIWETLGNWILKFLSKITGGNKAHFERIANKVKAVQESEGYKKIMAGEPIAEGIKISIPAKIKEVTYSTYAASAILLWEPAAWEHVTFNKDGAQTELDIKTFFESHVKPLIEKFAEGGSEIEAAKKFIEQARSVNEQAGVFDTKPDVVKSKGFSFFMNDVVKKLANNTDGELKTALFAANKTEEPSASNLLKSGAEGKESLTRAEFIGNIYGKTAMGENIDLDLAAIRTVYVDGFKGVAQIFGNEALFEKIKVVVGNGAKIFKEAAGNYKSLAKELSKTGTAAAKSEDKGAVANATELVPLLKDITSISAWYSTLIIEFMITADLYTIKTFDMVEDGISKLEGIVGKVKVEKKEPEKKEESKK